MAPGRKRKRSRKGEPLSELEQGEPNDVAGKAGEMNDEGQANGGEKALEEALKAARRRRKRRKEKALAALKRAERAGRVKTFSELIAWLGRERQSGFAEEAYRRLRKIGKKPDVLLMTRLMNCFARAGEPASVEWVWRQMESLGIEPNEVALTVRMKGLAQEGRFSEAIRLATSFGSKCNSRTFDALLRGCVKWADGRSADSIMEVLIHSVNESCGTSRSSYEYAIRAMCADGMPRRAEKMKRLCEQRFSHATAQAYVALAQLFGVMGKRKKAMELAKNARRVAKDERERAEGTDSHSHSLYAEFRADDATAECNAVEGSIMSNQCAPGMDWKSSRNVAFFVEDSASGVVDLEGMLGFRPERIHCELCSGDGNRIVEVAKEALENGREREAFIAVEWRRDRAYLTWLKCYRSGLMNVAIAVADAKAFIESHVKSDSLASIAVHFPDPPPHPASESMRLVDERMLSACYAALAASGEMRVVTDDAEYAMDMQRALAKVSSSFRASGMSLSDPVNESGTFFDRLWENGSRLDRFVLTLAK